MSQFGEVLKKAQSFPAILSVNVILKMAAKVIQCEGHLAFMANIDQHKKLCQWANLGNFLGVHIVFPILMLKCL